MTQDSIDIIVKCLNHDLEMWASIAEHHRDKLAELQAQYEDGIVSGKRYAELSSDINGYINEANEGYAKAMNALVEFLGLHGKNVV